MLGQITATISHELRNPLGTLSNSANLLERCSKRGDSVSAELVEIVHRNIERCNRIISDLLNFTRVDELVIEQVELDSWLLAI